MTEIEIKARVADPAKTENAIRAFASFERETVKRDEYWGLEGPEGVNGPTGSFTKVRVRDEDGVSTVTYKRKETRGDIEVNDEREFTVSDRDALESLLSDIGFSAYIRKEKRTKVFGCRAKDGTPVTIELSLVARLGWFVELEILADGPDEGGIARAEAALRETLERCGLPESSVEPRFYTEMLSALGDAPAGTDAASGSDAADFQVPAK